MHHPVCFFAVVTGLSLTLLQPRGAADEPQPDSAVERQAATPEQLQFVRQKVLPLLEARCFECHKQGSEPKGGLTLSGREAMLRGGDSGPAIVPGSPEESLLVEAIRYEGFEMPPRTRMPKQEVDILVQWIADGAVWPQDLESAPAATHNHFPLQERRQSHWAWQPMADPPVPVVTSVEGDVSAVDAFVLQQLDANQLLTQSPTADRHTLIRRLYFDIIGLPPSIAQVEAFVNDSRPIHVAIRDVVDELLASPHFGERWARHWLDLVRYAETLGHEFDYPLHNAWRYRDYVIRAFNSDVPYDDFVREHVAGDLLPQPRRHPVEQFNESIIGTGFWYLSEDKHAPVDVRAEEAAKIDNQIDVFSKTFLGMTVACARCHDHKFDAISTADYYALAGFLQSSRRQTAWLDPGRKIEARLQHIKSLREQATAQLNQHSLTSDTAATLAPYLLAALDVAHTTEASQATPPTESATVAAIAQQHGCNAEQLQKWMVVLKDPQTTDMAHPLSLPAMLVQTAPDVPVADVVAAWQADVQRGLSDPSNAAVDTTLFADLTHGLPDGWFAVGDAFASSITNDETGPGLQWAESSLRQNRDAGVTSAALARRLRGTLSSPTFELQYPEILVKVSGEKTRVRLVIDGYLMYEFSELLFKGARQSIDTAGQIRWLRLSDDVQRYSGHRAHLEFLDEGHGWFNVLEVRFANKPGASPSEYAVSAVNVELTNTAAMAQADTHAAVVHEWIGAATANSGETTAMLFNQDLLPGLAADTTWQSLVSEWRQSADDLPDPMPVIAMTEGTPENERVFIRGNPRNLGAESPRNLLTALRMESKADTKIPAESSGRLQLAEQLVSADNPLTARVAVNRVWHHLFGAGLVESTDNFGVLGKTPSHPELLDHLATGFRRSGWSLKSLIRTLVLSKTYQASSHASDQARRLDPTNRLLHSANIRRLQGEAVRDAILTVSGRLDRTSFGPAVPVHLTKFMQGRGRPKTNGPLDGNGRRSLYLSVNRNFLSPFMQAFDVPAPVTTIGTRTTSNVPAQALIMLNNEFVNQQAEQWARRLLSEPNQSATEILHHAWYELFSRPASHDEIQDLLLYLNPDPNADPEPVEVESLTEICHVLLNSKEFLFLQ